jgi:aspartokinase
MQIGFKKIMFTVSDIVETLVARQPFIEEGLSRELINLSSLARQLKPQIEKKLYKKVQLGSIVMALKRLSERTQQADKTSELNQVLSMLGDMTVRSNIVEYTFENSSTLAEKQTALMHEAAKQPNSFLTITDGVFETAFFASLTLADSIEQHFKGEKIKSKVDGLSSITIIVPESAQNVPGVYYSILKKLAWNGINFIEVVSSFTELTIFIRNEDVDRAFSVLKN